MLYDLLKKQDWSNTIFLLNADHGNHQNLGFLLELGHDFRESLLPMMMLMLPQSVAQTYKDNLVHNENALVSSWDVYNLIGDLSGNIKSYDNLSNKT
mmetsp:Transcript_45432/g.99286  ORF Transcript_45432/g.99286 Transcript_45432/m.99286 type:complete len:97 (+) Transcript_45432:1992-2282(+)